ncbi:tetratricopeptide repeat protein [Kitasatospora azatica]|uniref:tetratricopeptide repeat protein n=1 Tax=Kitasatospora azatica TaxID=58347 RepID=UPI000566FA4E|nr:tetratricopeptide repeat protein [Kitasatospora azatica]
MTRPKPFSALRRRRLLPVAAVGVLGVGMFLAGGLGLASPSGIGQSDTGPAARRPGTVHEASTSADTLAGDIAGLQERLREAPQDAPALGTLGLDYVQQARITVDPSYYPKAEAVLTQSLKLDAADNFTAMAGMAALEAARHNFASALDWAQRAIAVNPDNATLSGILADAYTQLGRYADSFDAVQHMVDLRPGTPSLARASYAWELRGDVNAATENMTRALNDANTPADRAFTLYHLAQLALENGDPKTALAHAEAGLRAAPGSAELLEGRARAEAALGNADAALADYTSAVAKVPQPSYVLELGELLQSLGRTREAEQQYQVFRGEEKLFTDNGVALDSDQTLFEADHGDPAKALSLGENGLRTRPFVEMHDAYAWALHVNGHDTEALEQSRQATALGMRNALFHYHQGMIEKALGHPDRALAELHQALTINDHFSPIHAPVARAAIQDLGAGQ